MIEQIGERLIELRKNQEISQEELADKIGVTRQAISKWERGEGLPDLYNTVNLAEFFNISLDELIAGDKVKQKNEIVGMELKRKSDKLSIIAVIIFPISGLFGLIGPRLFSNYLYYLGEYDPYLSGFVRYIIIGIAVLCFIIGLAISMKAINLDREFKLLNEK